MFSFVSYKVICKIQEIFFKKIGFRQYHAAWPILNVVSLKFWFDVARIPICFLSFQNYTFVYIYALYFSLYNIKDLIDFDKNDAARFRSCAPWFHKSQRQ